LKDLGAYGRRGPNEMDVREAGWEVVDWIHLAQDRDQWRTVMKFIFRKRRGISCLAE